MCPTGPRDHLSRDSAVYLVRLTVGHIRASLQKKKIKKPSVNTLKQHGKVKVDKSTISQYWKKVFQNDLKKSDFFARVETIVRNTDIGNSLEDKIWDTCNKLLPTFVSERYDIFAIAQEKGGFDDAELKTLSHLSSASSSSSSENATSTDEPSLLELCDSISLQANQPVLPINANMFDGIYNTSLPAPKSPSFCANSDPVGSSQERLEDHTSRFPTEDHVEKLARACISPSELKFQ